MGTWRRSEPEVTRTPEFLDPDHPDGVVDPIPAGERPDHEAAARTLAAGLGWEGDDARLRRSPRVEMTVASGDGELWELRYDVASGRVSGEPVAARGMDAGRFMQRLHKARTYPDEGLGVRFWWAILVDVMAGAMVLWGASGVLMWWQMKNLRRIGAVVLVLAGVGAAMLMGGMAAEMG